MAFESFDLSFVECAFNDHRIMQDWRSLNFGQSAGPVARTPISANGPQQRAFGTYLHICGGFLPGIQDFFMICFALFYGPG